MTAKGFSLSLLEEAEEMSNVQWHVAMIERSEQSHGTGCACPWCAIGRVLDMPPKSIDRGNFKKSMLAPYRSRVVRFDGRHR